MCGRGIRVEEGRPLRGHGSHVDYKYGLELGGRQQKWGEVIFCCCLYLIFCAVHGLSLVVASGGYSLVVACSFSLWWLLSLWSTGSRACGLQ